MIYIYIYITQMYIHHIYTFKFIIYISYYNSNGTQSVDNRDSAKRF